MKRRHGDPDEVRSNLGFGESWSCEHEAASPCLAHPSGARFQSRPDGRKHEGPSCPKGALFLHPDSGTGSVTLPCRPWQSRWAEVARLTGRGRRFTLTTPLESHSLAHGKICPQPRRAYPLVAHALRHVAAHAFPLAHISSSAAGGSLRPRTHRRTSGTVSRGVFGDERPRQILRSRRSRRRNGSQRGPALGGAL